MSNLITVDNCYVTLLSLAEGFRACSPPDIRSSVQCLQAVLNLPLDQYTLAKTHLQLGDLIMRFTTNTDVACKHLEDAWQLAHNVPGADDIRLEAIAMLAATYERANNLKRTKELLTKGLESSSNRVWWHCKFLFHLAQIEAFEHNYAAAADILSAGAEFAQMSGASYSRILFLLSKGMILMINQRLNEALPVLSLAQQYVEAWQGNAAQKESLTLFYLILQVCFNLNGGKAKSAKQSLKYLQQMMQNSNYESATNEVYSPNGDGGFHWMSKEHICILVFLVNVLHSMQAGYMDRAQKYTEKALMQIDKLKSHEDHPLLNTFQLIILEHISMCRLVMGNRSMAMKEIVQAVHALERDYRLRPRHVPVLRSLLGLYCMSMNNDAMAEYHLTAVLRSTTAASELKILASLNLSIVYLRLHRYAELSDLLSKLNPDTIQSGSQAVKAACSYVFGLNAFFHNRINDAKRFLRNTLQLANTEELNRLTSCSLVLLGHIFFSLGNSKESMNMVTPAMELATKIPDIHVQVWATALLKELYRLFQNHVQAQSMEQLHAKFSHQVVNDCQLAYYTQEHSFYINWNEEV